MTTLPLSFKKTQFNFNGFSSISKVLSQRIKVQFSTLLLLSAPTAVAFQALLQKDSLYPSILLMDEVDVSDPLYFTAVFTIVGLLTWGSSQHLQKHGANRTLNGITEQQRLAEFGRISAGFLHEIANPLTAASLNLELLAAKHPKHIRRVKDNLKHLEDYLEAARQQILGNSQLRLFSVSGEITRVLSLVSPQASGRGIKINTYNCSNNYKLFGDPVKFSQILANLLINAIDAYNINSLKPLNKKIILTASQQNKYLVISVHDFGSGIKLRQLKHIFKPFYTTKNASHHNLGIGLSTVKQFVENDFKGSITVKSSAVDGTIFTICLLSDIG